MTGRGKKRERKAGRYGGGKGRGGGGREGGRDGRWERGMIGLFCKRALQDRRYSAKETFNFKGERKGGSKGWKGEGEENTE